MKTESREKRLHPFAEGLRFLQFSLFPKDQVQGVNGFSILADHPAATEASRLQLFLRHCSLKFKVLPDFFKPGQVFDLLETSQAVEAIEIDKDTEAKEKSGAESPILEHLHQFLFFHINGIILSLQPIFPQKQRLNPDSVSMLGVDAEQRSFNS